MRLRHALSALSLLAACAAPVASVHALPASPPEATAPPADFPLAMPANAPATVPDVITRDTAAAESLHVFVIAQVAVSRAVSQDSAELRVVVSRAVATIATSLSGSPSPAVAMAVVLRPSEPPNPMRPTSTRSARVSASRSPRVLPAPSADGSETRSRRTR